MLYPHAFGKPNLSFPCFYAIATWGVIARRCLRLIVCVWHLVPINHVVFHSFSTNDAMCNHNTCMHQIFILVNAIIKRHRRFDYLITSILNTKSKLTLWLLLHCVANVNKYFKEYNYNDTGSLDVIPIIILPFLLKVTFSV